MKNKRIFFLLILVLIIILISLYFIIKNFNSKNTNDNNSFSEYTPEEEISSKQMRETTVSLFFVDSEGNIKSEGKLIDSAILLENPYKELINLLLAGSESDGLASAFPENTKLLDAKIDNGCVILDFSEEFLNFKDETQKFNMINCVLNTLKQLNEVNSVKFLIGGNLKDGFEEIYNVTDNSIKKTGISLCPGLFRVHKFPLHNFDIIFHKVSLLIYPCLN